ncbi:hypothetical protein GAPWK_1510 [Gilliamella apicola]|nr:hypothetical protein GAPWK_1510 [Gilliamella apicola]
MIGLNWIFWKGINEKSNNDKAIFGGLRIGFDTIFEQCFYV